MANSDEDSPKITDKLTPFSSKAKDIARNLSMTSDKLINCSQLIAQINSHMTDLIILADEVDLQDGEIEDIAKIVQEGMESTQGLHQEIATLDGKTRDVITKMFGPDGLGDYMDREVVNPYDPIFTYKESNIVNNVLNNFIHKETKEMKNLKNKLIRLGNTNPELRKHLKPVLDEITAGSKISNENLEDTIEEELKSVWDSFVEYGGDTTFREGFLTEFDFKQKAKEKMPPTWTVRLDYIRGHIVLSAQDQDGIEHYIARIDVVTLVVDEISRNSYSGDDAVFEASHEVFSEVERMLEDFVYEGPVHFHRQHTGDRDITVVKNNL